MAEIVTADIGGTHARFALARIAAGGVALEEPVTLRTADHASLALAWAAFADRLGRPPPRAAAFAVAGPVGGAVLRFTNNPWVIRPDMLAGELGLDRVVLVNDFGAVGHAVAHAGVRHLAHVCGPDLPLDGAAVVSVVGPGTGLGVSQVVRTPAGTRVIETEGGHVDFAALDPLEDRILAHLRTRYRRVSAERIVSGPGLANLVEALAAIGGQAVPARDGAALWAAALDGGDPLAAAALERFCLSFGAVAGDVALAHGAGGVALAGGIGLRLADRLARSGFAERFTAKGRFAARMAAMPVRLVTHPQPGLLGAAWAFADGVAMAPARS